MKKIIVLGIMLLTGSGMRAAHYSDGHWTLANEGRRSPLQQAKNDFINGIKKMPKLNKQKITKLFNAYVTQTNNQYNTMMQQFESQMQQLESQNQTCLNTTNNVSSMLQNAINTLAGGFFPQISGNQEDGNTPDQSPSAQDSQDIQPISPDQSTTLWNTPDQSTNSQASQRKQTADQRLIRKQK